MSKVHHDGAPKHSKGGWGVGFCVVVFVVSTLHDALTSRC